VRLVVPVLRLAGMTIPTHEFFVALGVLVACAVFAAETRRRGQVRIETFVVATGALVGGAIGMRVSGWARHLDPTANPALAVAWQYGARSILGGLAGAYVGVLLTKWIIGYRVSTGDLFAPAVAIGMAIGRIGCLLTEAPGRPTGLPWGVHAPGSVPACPGCAAGLAMHPSFAYEIAFHLIAFAALWWISHRHPVPVKPCDMGTPVTQSEGSHRHPVPAKPCDMGTPVTQSGGSHRHPVRAMPGDLFVYYVAGYALFRFLVEFTRANETVWLGLTRPQWFLLPFLPLLAWRLVHRFRTSTAVPASAAAAVPRGSP
jgi:phosphatidylglycerol:prolipoprotein diacylglycerol transferase